ncbi:MAG TPA: metallophosphoesterase, partial [Planctomycetota bacterium]
ARQNYRFAAFGDAGGRTALRWGLQRAAELGADFVLHVGDFYYADGDVEGAAAALRDAAVPVYAAIGNHDFHGGHRNRHREFTDAIGPRNAYFALGGVLFANLDTAADTVPAGAGRRGDVLAALPGRASLMTLDAPTPLVVFTHRPLDDPRVVDGSREASHALNRRAEAEWLRDFVLGVGDVDWIAGHVHASHAFEHDGLRQWVAGDGLGLRGEQARILVGDWTPGGAVSLRFEPLAMPAVTLAQVLAENPDR